jgi:hypothetical protein
VVSRSVEAAGPEVLMVPYRLTREGDGKVDEALDAADGEWSPDGVRASLQSEGRVFVKGPADAFELETEWKPRGLELDPSGEILAWFHGADRTPREFRIYRAEDLALERRFAEAEAAYREALVLPPDPPRYQGDPAAELTQKSMPDLEGVRIRFALARLALDQDRESDAERWLAEVEEILKSDDETYRLEREVLAMTPSRPDSACPTRRSRRRALAAGRSIRRRTCRRGWA